MKLLNPACPRCGSTAGIVIDHHVDLSPELAEKWATLSAHYGRLALADRDVQADGWRVIHGAGGVK